MQFTQHIQWSLQNNIIDVQFSFSAPRCSGYRCYTNSRKLELRLCAGSNPARGVLEICDGENLWQWSRLELKLKSFRRSTIPQKQFIRYNFLRFDVDIDVDVDIIYDIGKFNRISLGWNWWIIKNVFSNNKLFLI